jgi:hypothetical protein
MTMVMFALVGLALTMVLLSTAVVEAHRRPRHPASPVREVGGPLPATVTLCGEALFATGLDPGAVLLDCLLGLRSARGDTPAVLQPATLRVRDADRQPTALLPDVVRVWAERGERVFVELPFSVKPWRARLRCGERAVTVAVDNGGEVWRTIGSSTRRSEEGRRSIW